MSVDLSRGRGLPGRLRTRPRPAALRPAVRRRRRRGGAGRRRRLPQPGRRLRLGPGARPPIADQPAGRRAARVRGVRRRRAGDDRPGARALRLAGRRQQPATAACRSPCRCPIPRRARRSGWAPTRRRRCRSPRSWRPPRIASRPPIAAVAAHPWLARATGYCLAAVRALGPEPARDGAGVRRPVPGRGGAPPRGRGAGRDPAPPRSGGRRCCTWPAVPTTSSCARSTSPRSPAAPPAACSTPGVVEAELERLAAGQQADGGWAVDFDSYSPAADPRVARAPHRPGARAAARQRAALSAPAQAGRRMATRKSASGVNGRRSQVDSSRSGAQPVARGVGEEVVELVAAAGSEADRRPAAGPQVRQQPAQHLAPGATAPGTSSRCPRTRSRRTARRCPRAGRSSSARSPTVQRAPGCPASASAIRTGSTSTPTTSCPSDARCPPTRPCPQPASSTRDPRATIASTSPGLAHDVHALGGQVLPPLDVRRPSAAGSPR